MKELFARLNYLHITLPSGERRGRVNAEAAWGIGFVCSTGKGRGVVGGLGSAVTHQQHHTSGQLRKYSSNEGFCLAGVNVVCAE